MSFRKDRAPEPLADPVTGHVYTEAELQEIALGFVRSALHDDILPPAVAQVARRVLADKTTKED
jgi:hypothetical protein